MAEGGAADVTQESYVEELLELLLGQAELSPNLNAGISSSAFRKRPIAHPESTARRWAGSQARLTTLG
jgi:hypothetical protein